MTASSTVVSTEALTMFGAIDRDVVRLGVCRSVLASFGQTSISVNGGQNVELVLESSVRSQPRGDVGDETSNLGNELVVVVDAPLRTFATGNVDVGAFYEEMEDPLTAGHLSQFVATVTRIFKEEVS
ncbi:hypothetical protein MPER_09208, partial [Moniliophthora perniciosa FA553]